MESPRTLADYVQEVSQKAAHRVGITDPYEVDDLYQNYFARLLQSVDFPHDLQLWLELHARREAEAHKKRNQRSASRGPLIDDLELAPSADTGSDPSEEAYANELLISLPNIADDDFEKSALAWMLGATRNAQTKSQFLSTQKDYSKGHAYKRIKQLEAKVLDALEG